MQKRELHKDERRKNNAGVIFMYCVVEIVSFTTIKTVIMLNDAYNLIKLLER